MVSHAEDNCTQSKKFKNTGQTGNAVSDDKWTASLVVHGTNETFTVVTGAKANLINESDFKALSVKRQIFSGKVLSLKAYNNQPIKTRGGCKMNVTAKGKQHDLLFTIVPDGHESLLGDKASAS